MISDTSWRASRVALLTCQCRDCRTKKHQRGWLRHLRLRHPAHTEREDAARGARRWVVFAMKGSVFDVIARDAQTPEQISCDKSIYAQEQVVEVCSTGRERMIDEQRREDPSSGAITTQGAAKRSRRGRS